MTAIVQALFMDVGGGAGGTGWVANGNAAVISNGALTVSMPNSANASLPVLWYSGTSSAKWYWEMQLAIVGSETEEFDSFGIGNSSMTVASGHPVGGDANGWGYEMQGFAPGAAHGYGVHNASFTSDYTLGFGNGSIVMVALDMVNGKVYFGVGGTWANSGNPVAGTGYIYSGLSGTLYPAAAVASNTSQNSWTMQTSNTYTIPSGFSYIG